MATDAEGDLPPDEGATSAQKSEATTGDGRDPGLGPFYAVLRAAFKDRIPDGPLGPETVPTAVLELPIELATNELKKHAKRCKNPRCPHVPMPLQPFRRMRPDVMRKAKARAQMHKVLWTHSKHEFVVSVREQILQRHRDLASEISTGALLVGDRLGEVLNKLSPGSVAAVLWATEFKGPSADTLFRSLIPLVEGPISRNVEPNRVVLSDDRQTKTVKVKLKTTIREREQAKQAASRAKDDLKVTRRALEKSKREREDVQQKCTELAAELERVQQRFRETDGAYRELGRDGEKASKSNAKLRRELHDLQDMQGELDVGRSDLARQLAGERRRSEQLKLQLAAVLRGSDGMYQFIRDEEARIRTEQMITSGGAKERADLQWRDHRKLESAFLDAYPQYRQPPPVRIRTKTSLRLVALGGSGEVGRSCYLLELGQHRILVDCGIKPGAEDLHPAIECLERVDALVLTHAHTDHIGWVPALVRRFPDLDIYCSDGTAALVPVMLQDCHQHYVRKMAVKRRHAQYISNAPPVEEEYDSENVQMVSNLLITCRFDETEALPFGDASIRFYPAGHILGAASVLIEDQSGRRVFFSGDFSSFPQLTLPAAEWPQDLGDIDLLVLESTYGGRDHKPFNESRRELVSFTRQTIENEGSVILASFGLGRAQELLKLLVKARENGDLPTVPIYVDGMIRRINPIYRKLANFDCSPEFFNEVSGETERQEIAFAAQTRPCIIVTTSGMLAGGPVIQYVRHLLPDPRHRIVLTGYQDEGSPSKAVREITATGRRRVKFENECGEAIEFEVAKPAKEVGLSSHADQQGLVEYAGRLRPRHIALVHGEAIGQEKLRSRLRQVHSEAEVVCGPSEFTVP